MTYSKATSQATAEDWRTLGFYYECDEIKQEWRFVGSRTGLRNLAYLFIEYSSNPYNMRNSEHQHYGPYMYLKIATAPDFGIGKYGFRGSLDNFHDLGRQINDKIMSAAQNTTIIFVPVWSGMADYRLIFDVRQEGFDPASADQQLDLSMDI